MKKVAVIVSMLAAALVVGAAAASYLVDESASRPAVAPTTWVTLTLSATGDSKTRITYTCADEAGTVGVCDATGVSPMTPWSEQVSVPAGTTVRLQARGGLLRSLCTIADSTDRLRLDHAENGECEVVAR